MATPRRVVVDDTDGGIKYSGDWFQDHSSANDDPRFWGTTFQRSMHGTNTSASFTFSFQGSAVYMYSRTNILRINNGTQSDPTWLCYVDDLSIEVDAPYIFPENNVNTCKQENLKDGPHTLSVKVTVLTPGATFFLDDIQFVPSPGVTLDNSVLKVSYDDPGITYSSGWAKMDGAAGGIMGTQTHGETMKFSWTGTSLSWLASIPTDKPWGSTTGSYSIDGGDSVAFTLDGLSTYTDVTRMYQTFFTTPNLQPGPHTIVVTYLGDSTHTPLTLDFLYISNAPPSSSTGALTGPTPASSAGTVSSGSHPTGSLTGSTITFSPTDGTGTNSHATDLSTSTQNSSQKAPIGVIVGGAVGGIAIIIIAALIFLLLRRRRRTIRLPSRELPPNAENKPTVTPYMALSGSFGSSPTTSQTNLVNSTQPFEKQAVLNQYGQLPQSPGYPSMSSSSAPSSVGDDLRPLRRTVDGRSVQTGGSDLGPIQHHDSGVRLGGGSEAEYEMTEVPPLYSRN